MKIDMYTHILPPKYLDTLGKRVPQAARQASSVWDLEQRFRIMDKFDDYRQVLVFSTSPEIIADPKGAVELARSGNDELAEIIVKHPDRFVAGVASLPMNDMDAALKEADRAINELGLKGVYLYTNINGKPLDSPEFMPLYEKMAHYDLPIWIHPRREKTVADYSTESESKYSLHGALGWPYETQLAMCRLAYSGVLERYPNLKFITHHCGGGIPYFGNRLDGFFTTHIEQDPNTELTKLTKEPSEYLRMFYGDTALEGNTPALECGYAFFGAEHVVFGTDMPFGKEHGDYPITVSIRSITEMAIADSDRQKIFEGNAKRLLHL